ncbi:type II toxin-antitoxin system HicA family toxin [Mesotoga sp.]|uniref:type II toxin-antitoxin system HicA family toxin n=1 Tax=Mesotoga sp. TaxID=2053577 RepID=UPI00345E58AE
MKLPRDLGCEELLKALTKLGYEVSRQTGSHVRLTTKQKGEHHITIPQHSSLKPGTLNAILLEIADHFEITKKDLLELLFN